MTTSKRSTCSGTPPGRSTAAARRRLGKVADVAGPIFNSSVRVHPRTQLMRAVREATSSSRMPHIVRRLAGQIGGNVYRRQVDPTGNLAQHLCIAPIRLDSTSTDAEASHQRSWNDSHLVLVLQSRIGHVESFGARFEHHATVRLTLEENFQRPCGNPLLEQDLSVAAADTNLRFPSAEIDCNMLHGRLPCCAPRARLRVRPDSR